MKILSIFPCLFAPCLTVLFAAELEIPFTVDGSVIDTAPYGVFDEVISDATTLSLGNLLTDFTNPSERRMVLEMDLSLIPEGATITAAEIVLDGVSGTLGGMGLLSFSGYTGDGEITVEDATRLGPVLPNDITNNIVTIDVTTFLQTELQNESSHMGIVGRQNFLGVNWNFISSEWTADDRKGPTLVITYDLPGSEVPVLLTPAPVQGSSTLMQLSFDTLNGYIYQVETATVLGDWDTGPSYFGNDASQTYVFIKPDDGAFFIRIGVTAF